MYKIPSNPPVIISINKDSTQLKVKATGSSGFEVTGHVTTNPKFFTKELTIFQSLWNNTIGRVFTDYKWEAHIVQISDLPGTQQAVCYIYQKNFPANEIKVSDPNNYDLSNADFEYLSPSTLTQSSTASKSPSSTPKSPSSLTEPLISSSSRSSESASLRPPSPPRLTRTPSADLPKPPAKLASSQQLTSNQQTALDQLIKDLRMGSNNPSIAEINAAIATIRDQGGSDRVNSSIRRCEEVGIKGINYE